MFCKDKTKSCWRKTSSQHLADAEESMWTGVSKSIDSSFVSISDNNNIRTIKVGTRREYCHRTPVVLLHGFAAGCAFWALNMDELSAKQNVYAIDLLGFGRSSRPIFPDDHEGAEALYIHSLEEWRKQVGLSKFILVGHSFGGFLATSYAISHPERIEHLILADPWGFPEVPEPGNEPIEIPRLVKHLANVVTTFNPLAVLRVLGPIGPSVVRKFRSDIKFKFEKLYGEGDARIMDYIYHCNAQKPSGETAFMTMADVQPLPYAKKPMMNRLCDLDENVPINIIYGKDSWIQLMTSFESLRGVREKLVLHEMVGAGHHVYADKSEEFNMLINNICDINEFSKDFPNSTPV